MNILPEVGMYIGNDGDKVNPDISIMNILCESSELNLFNCDVVQDLIIFKWGAFAMKWHLIGCFYHFFYMIILCIYISKVYIHNGIDYKPDPGANDNFD